METSDCDRNAGASRPVAAVSRRVVAFLVVLVLCMTPAATGSAQPASESLQEKLARLNERAEQLAQQYRGDIVTLDQARTSAKKAMARAKQANQRLRHARKEVAQLAMARYKHGTARPALTLVMSSDSDGVLDKAATLAYLARSRSGRVREMKSLAADAERARKRAKARVAQVESKIDQLKEQRKRVAALIERFEAQQLSVGAGTDGDAGGDSGTSSEADNITPRMEHVRDLIIEKFGEPYSVGCYRPDTSGEHPEGRACDFMLSTGGAMPSSSQVQRGYRIAEWATAHASELGIMYVIYRQRIWDIRSGEGWQPMEDRGGVTANHYDHVHISVF